MPSVHIIYSSVGGNTQLCSQKVAELFQESKFTTKLFNAKLIDPAEILPADLLIFASPTYGRGALEKFMGIFFQKCEKTPNFSLENQKCAIIGMGDATYESDYFGESAALTKEWLLKQRAEVIHLPLMISQSPLPYFESYIPRWVNQVIEKLKNKSE